MRIDNLKLTNYRCFPELEIDFDEHFTVLVGANGSGKTALLEAVAVAFGTFLGCFDEGKGQGFKTSDVRLSRLDKQSTHLEPQYPLSLSARGMLNEEVVVWGRTLASPKARTTTKNAKPLTEFGQSLAARVRKDPNVALPLLATYGTGRLWQVGRLTGSRMAVLTRSRTSGYRDAMQSSATFKEFAHWLRRATYAVTQEHMAKTEETDSRPTGNLADLIRGVQKAIDAPLKASGWHTIHYQISQETVAAHHPDNGILPVSHLSDGVRNILALAADIAYRCCRLNPQYGEHAPEKTKGLVLIDELDMHLHPAWQQKVVGAFREAFPKLQFILTTHSPQLVTTVGSKHLRILNEQKVWPAPAGIQGAEAQRALSRIFGTESRPVDDPFARSLRKYLDLVFDDQWDTQEAEDLRASLKQHFKDEEPALDDADAHIANRKWERTLEEDRQE